MMGTINYEAPATLHKWQSLERKRASDPPTYGSFQEWGGTFAGCVKQYLAKPDSEKQLYDIMVGEDAGVGETILGPPVINEIAQREDFPREKTYEARAMDNWKPIDSAPRDGTPVLLWTKFKIIPAGIGDERGPVVGYWHQKVERWMDGRGDELIPSHWLNIPKPPTPAATFYGQTWRRAT